MKIIASVLLIVTIVSAASNDQCSYSVYRDCAGGGPTPLKSNLFMNSISGIKLDNVKKANPFGLKSYGGGGGGGDSEEEEDTYAKALCPCECARCPQPMKAQHGDYDLDDDECLCLCGTCGKTKIKNKLPSVVPLDCGLKCEVISEKVEGGGGSGSGSYGRK